MDIIARNFISRIQIVRIYVKQKRKKRKRKRKKLSHINLTTNNCQIKFSINFIEKERNQIAKYCFMQIDFYAAIK